MAVVEVMVVMEDIQIQAQQMEDRLTVQQPLQLILALVEQMVEVLQLEGLGEEP
jgi:hypothetical protein